MSLPVSTISGVAAGGGGAPVNAEYVVMVADATLTDERILTAGAGISIVDGGAGGPVTVSATAAASGWTDSGTVVHLTTVTDTVAIGAAVMVGTEKVRVTTGDFLIDHTSTTVFTISQTGFTGTKLVYNSTSGFLGIDARGTTLIPARNIQILSGLTANADIELDAVGAFAPYLIGTRALGTVAAPAVITDGDQMLSVEGRGYDGVAYTQARVTITFRSAGTWALADTPTRIEFSTTDVGSGVLTERMRIQQDGRVGIGTVAPTGKLHVVDAGGNVLIIDDSVNSFTFTTGATAIATAGLVVSGAGTFEIDLDTAVFRTSATAFVVADDIGPNVVLAVDTTAYTMTFTEFVNGTSIIFGNTGGGSAGIFTPGGTLFIGDGLSVDAHLVVQNSGGANIFDVNTTTAVVTVTGKLTVTGAIDPVSVLLSDPAAGTALFYESNDGQTAPVSGATTGRIRYNNATGLWQVSTQGGAYLDIATGTAPVNAFVQDGNSFGAVAVLGTNDAFDLSFETGGVTRSTITTTGEFQMVSFGTAALPAYSFTTDPNTGMFLLLADTLAFSTAGVQRWRFSSLGHFFSASHNTYDIGATGAGQPRTVYAGTSFLGPTGSAAAPTFSVDGDTNTGMFRAGADILSFSTAGTERGRFTATGEFQLVAGGSAATPAIALTGDTNTGIAWTAADTLVLSAGGVATVTVTNSSTAFITSSGTLNITGGTGGGPAITSSTDIVTVGDGASSSPFFQVLDAGGLAVLDVDSGAGTVTVNGKLTVTGAIDPTSILLSGGTALFYESNDGSTAAVSGATTGRIRFLSGTGWQVSSNGGAYATISTGAAANAFVQDGNSFGGTATLGTNDAFSLVFETSGTARQTISSTGTFAFAVPDNAASVFNIAEGANTYFRIDTTNASEQILIGDSGLAFGTVGLNGLNVALSAGALIALNLADNQATALNVNQGGNQYIRVDTSNGTEAMSFGNATTNPAFNFLGTGATDFAGDVTVNGKLTVVGAIDPTSVLLSGGTALFYESNDGSTAPVSGATTGRLRFLSGTGWQMSNNGAAYVTIGASTGNTLDQAYDQGGAGAGRIITADSGPVEIQGADGITVAGDVHVQSTILFDNAAGSPTVNGEMQRFGEVLQVRNSSLVYTVCGDSKAETITGAWDFSTAPTFSFPGVGATVSRELVFTNSGIDPATAGGITRFGGSLRYNDGATVSNLCGSARAETITGAWDFSTAPTFSFPGTSATISQELVFTNSGVDPGVTGGITRSGLNLRFNNGSSIESILSTGNGIAQDGNSFGTTMVLGTNDANPLAFETSGSTRYTISAGGDLTMNGDFDVVPGTDAQGELGTNALRWGSVRAVAVTTGDLNLIDERKDAHWRVVEERDSITVLNMKTGKRYKLAMEEVA